MIKLLFVFFSAILLQSYSVAHEIKENSAKISIYHGSVHLKLSVHPSLWTENFKIHKLDDEILKGTTLTINNTIVPLKLKKIEKRSHHYEINYLASKVISSNITNTSLIIPKQLGNVVVTVIRADTKLSNMGKRVQFSFK